MSCQPCHFRQQQIADQRIDSLLRNQMNIRRYRIAVEGDPEAVADCGI